jgi:FlaA1/EpsC-like NDP-sugar epimerase
MIKLSEIEALIFCVPENIMYTQTTRYQGPKGLLKLLVSLCFICIVIGFLVYLETSHYLILMAVILWGVAAILSIQTLRRYNRLEGSTHRPGRRAKRAAAQTVISLLFFLTGLILIGMLYQDALVEFAKTMIPLATKAP